MVSDLTSYSPFPVDQRLTRAVSQVLVALPYLTTSRRRTATSSATRRDTSGRRRRPWGRRTSCEWLVDGTPVWRRRAHCFGNGAAAREDAG